MLHGYQSPPLFVDDVDQPLGAADMNVLAGNAVLLDAATFRAPPGFASSQAGDKNQPYIVTAERLWWGSFQYLAGMTTLTIEGWAQRGASENFSLIVNGATKQTIAVPNGATFTLTWSLSGLTSGDVVEVEVQISNQPGSAAVTTYRFDDAYVSPAPTVATSWPSKPTFGGTYNAARLTQLANGAAHLYNRINAIPILPHIAQLYIHGRSSAGTFPLYVGSVERANGNDTLSFYLRIMNFGNVAEYYTVSVNGSVVYTSATYTVGNVAETYHSISLSSFSAGARLAVRVDSVVTTGAVEGPSGNRNTRFHLWNVRTTQSAPSVAVAPTEWTADESISASTVNGRLNAIATTLDGANTRITSTARVFNRVRLMRRMFGASDVQYAVFIPTHTFVQRFIRQGARLVVRGKAVTLAWGAISTKADKTVTTAYTVDFGHSTGLTDGDKVETKEIALDSIEGLRRGMSYFVFAENLVYCAEYLA